MILVDAILGHGKDIRAALEALLDYGRPSCIELAVLWDRGHRKLPIEPRYTGLHKVVDPKEKYAVLLYESAAQDQIVKLEDTASFEQEIPESTTRESQTVSC